MKHHKKLIVLMFENRSFDNMCGYLDNPNLNNITNYEKKFKTHLFNFTSDGKKIDCHSGHEAQLRHDPGEEF